MTEPQNTKATPPHRFGLTHEAIFRLWKTAINDDENLLDEAIAAVYDQMMLFDRVRGERVIGLIIRRHRDAKDAFRPFSVPTGRSGGPPVRRNCSGTSSLSDDELALADDMAPHSRWLKQRKAPWLQFVQDCHTSYEQNQKFQ
jgi:hypothetical protein